MMETRDRGPRLISEEEVQSYFSEDWDINYVKEARLDNLIHEGGDRAWIASITKL